MNVDKAAAGVALADETNYDFQPLFGLGFGYEIRPGIEAYANISSAYRPQIFTPAVWQVCTIAAKAARSPRRLESW